MNVLLVGAGGREDALGWALSRSPQLGRLRSAPGNAGIARHAQIVPIPADDIEALAAHAIAERYDLVVIGPEAPLVGGLADRLRDAGLAVFGPSAGAARIEGSKAFAKEFLARHQIPTAAFTIFTERNEAARYFLSDEAAYPLVVKADGLAAGKGVVIATDPESALETAEGMLSGRAFGLAGRRIVVEEMLRGQEVSFFVLSDGESLVELPTCQDYKRVGDRDTGPNTGGMGSYSPSAFLDEASAATILDAVARPTVEGLAREGLPYRGVLYIGIMLTPSGPKVLEFNARFGDPETQALVPRLDGDWLALLDACANGRLPRVAPRWKPNPTVCVVMTTRDYPGSYPKGIPILGLDDAESLPGVQVFHAGTERGLDGGYRAVGGRVLGVTAIGDDLRHARTRVYQAVGLIRWEGEHHRGDVALDALEES